MRLHTLDRWAFEDGWRQKDLAAEAAEEHAAAIERHLAERRAELRAAQPRPDAGQPGSSSSSGPVSGEVLEFKSRDGGPPRAPGVVSRPAGAVPDWAPVLDPNNRDDELEEIALWLARDLFMRGKIAEAQRSLRFAASWIAISRQVWAIEEERSEAHRAYSSSSSRGG